MNSLPQKPQPRKNEQQVDLFATPPAWEVYVLCDPRVTNPVLRVRYVGITSRGVDVRLQCHLREARLGKAKTHKVQWIRSLLAKDLAPSIEVVDSGVAERPWDRNEIAWIAYYRALGCSLTNGCDGGKGIINPTEEMRARQSAIAKASCARPEVRARKSAAARAAQGNPEYRAKKSADSRAAQARPEVKRKHREAVKAACARPDVKEKRGAAMRKRWEGPEGQIRRAKVYPRQNGRFSGKAFESDTTSEIKKSSANE